MDLGGHHNGATSVGDPFGEPGQVGVGEQLGVVDDERVLGWIVLRGTRLCAASPARCNASRTAASTVVLPVPMPPPINACTGAVAAFARSSITARAARGNVGMDAPTPSLTRPPPRRIRGFQRAFPTTRSFHALLPAARPRNPIFPLTPHP